MAVAEELHFGRAAARVFLSQPSLSYQVARLEDELGVRLLERDRRSVRLTDAGRAFLREAKLTLAQAERAEDAVRPYRANQGGTLRLAFVALEYASTPVVRAGLADVRTHHPGASIEFKELTSAPLVRAMLRGEVDAGFVHLPIATTGVTFRALQNEAFHLALPDQHRLAARNTLREEDLRGERLLLYAREEAPEVHDLWANVAARLGMRVALAPDVLQAGAMLEHVAAGEGLVAYPSMVATRHQGLGVAFRGLESGAFDLTWGVAFVEGRTSLLLSTFLAAMPTATP